MTVQRAILIFIIGGLIVLAAAFYIASAGSPSSNIGFKDAAAALTFITGASIVIERVIEMLWTFIGSIGGAYWPLNAVSKQVDVMVTNLDDALKPVYASACQGIQKLSKAANIGTEKLATAEQEVETMQTHFEELKKVLPKGNQRMALLAAAAAQNVDLLYKKYGEHAADLKDAVQTANAAISGLQDFLTTFKDNPGRRLISIYIGVVLGVLIAGAFGLDLFQAVLDNPAQQLSATPVPIRIFFTGLVIGLGSNPTHEVIRAIQEFKENQKGQNVSTPSLARGT